jgi:hypothetical protein
LITSSRFTSLILVLMLLSACTVGGVDVEQEQASGLAGELLDGHTLGQTFTLQYDGLYRVDLYTATYARENTHPVIFRISPVPAGGGGACPELVEGVGEGAMPRLCLSR